MLQAAGRPPEMASNGIINEAERGKATRCCEPQNPVSTRHKKDWRIFVWFLEEFCFIVALSLSPCSLLPKKEGRSFLSSRSSGCVKGQQRNSFGWHAHPGFGLRTYDGILWDTYRCSFPNPFAQCPKSLRMVGRWDSIGEDRTSEATSFFWCTQIKPRWCCVTTIWNWNSLSLSWGFLCEFDAPKDRPTSSTCNRCSPWLCVWCVLVVVCGWGQQTFNIPRVLVLQQQLVCSLIVHHPACRQIGEHSTATARAQLATGVWFRSTIRQDKSIVHKICSQWVL